MTSRHARFGLIACAAFLLCACGSQAALAPEAARGQTLDVLNQHTPASAQVVVQDVSTIVDLEPSYPVGAPESWIILAACADSATIDDASYVEVSVIPAESTTRELRGRIQENDFRPTVGDCS
ncbi:hypothetical protein [Isoptericola sp. NPDC057191]|uniref:hypothetical protein n=1 Tax=Isoptericola sp. NPDC057191 TaxID=3346041 RepID=UPI00362F27F3